MGSGNWYLWGSPDLASSSMTYAPGYPRSSIRANLSRASPAASSRVWATLIAFRDGVFAVEHK